MRSGRHRRRRISRSSSSSTSSTRAVEPLAPLSRSFNQSPAPSLSSNEAYSDIDTVSLMPLNYTSPISSPPPQHAIPAHSSRSYSISHTHDISMIDKADCKSPLVSEMGHFEDIIEKKAREEEDDDDKKEEEHREEGIESLRRFRTQQAMRNLLLEREVQILQVRNGV